MTASSILAFSGAFFLLSITPGPGVLATVGRSMTSGIGNAMVFAFGLACGDLIFLNMAVHGLAAVATVMGDFFTVIRYAGAAYLLWIGISMFRDKVEDLDEGQGVKRKTGVADFFSGFAVTLGNPKVILFYLSFLPTFMDLRQLTVIDIVTVSLLIIGILLTVLFSYALLASRGSRFFNTRKARVRMNRCAGTAMTAAGAFILAEN